MDRVIKKKTPWIILWTSSTISSTQLRQNGKVCPKMLMTSRNSEAFTADYPPSSLHLHRTKQIHGILLDSHIKANRAMLDDISKIPREFINNGEKRWIELSKKRLLESSFGLQVQYPLHNSVRMAKFVRKCWWWAGTRKHSPQIIRRHLCICIGTSKG